MQLVLAKKPTKFMTNSRSIGRALSRKCNGDHIHQPLVDGRAKDAARYPPALRKAICRGVAKEKMQRQLGIRAAAPECTDGALTQRSITKTRRRR